MTRGSGIGGAAPLLLALVACEPFAPLLATDTSLVPEVRVVLEERSYPVRGKTLDAIGRSLNGGPLLWNGFRAYALTRWTVRWEWERRVREGACRFIAPQVTVVVEMTLPAWQDEVGSGRRVVDAWRRFDGSLRTHEYGHHDMALAAGTNVLRLLREIRTPECEDLPQAAAAAVGAVVERYERLNERYEQTSRRGIEQGVVWPPDS